MSNCLVSNERTVVCPQCGGSSLFSPRNAFRPFCSQRCKLGDLGRWASEDFRVAEATPPDTGIDRKHQ
jgi:endogenous inhibitor of DNA gyrase (YacG/DUF329 family)